MPAHAVDFEPLRRSLGVLEEAIAFWQAEPEASALKKHLRAAVIQAFEFVYELSVRTVRRVLLERAASAPDVIDLSFFDLLRAAADAGLLADPIAWRRWREMRNITSHAYNEEQAQRVVLAASAFAADARASLHAMEPSAGS